MIPLSTNQTSELLQNRNLPSPIITQSVGRLVSAFGFIINYEH